MPDVTESEIQKVLALAEKASPGPWENYYHRGEVTTKDWHHYQPKIAVCKGENNHRNGDFIAFANPAFVKRLASELLSLRKSSHSVSQCCPMSERLERENAELRAIVERLPNIGGPLPGRWHHGNGTLCCGTLRIARQDFDTNPSDAFKTEVLDWICARLNSAGDEKCELCKHISANIPLTADGQPFLDGRSVWAFDVQEQKMKHLCVMTNAQELVCVDPDTNSWLPGGVSYGPKVCYSTRELAEAALAEAAAEASAKGVKGEV